MVEPSAIDKEYITYGSDVNFKGFVAHNSTIKEKVPGILIVHEVWGLDDYCRSRAIQLAEWGYAALALDMYGEGKTFCHPKDCMEYMHESLKTFDKSVTERFTLAVETLKKYDFVDSTRIAAIGYCFGGLIVLNMAKKGLDLKGVASFHGSLQAPVKAEKGVCKAKALVCNGEDDPLVTKEDIEALKKEFDEAGIEYKFINYAGATHSFTVPESSHKNKVFGLPVGYNEKADKESWAELEVFLKDVFSK